MFDRSGYFIADNKVAEFESPGFIVCSCGFYRLEPGEVSDTVRPTGRPDWQLLYFAAGKGAVERQDELLEVGEGGVVLFPPGCRQRYLYRYEDKPEVYWLHFTGGDARQLLEEAGLLTENIHYVRRPEQMREAFDRIIRELQVFPAAFPWMAGALAQALLCHIGREARQPMEQALGPIRSIMEEMHRSYPEHRTVEDYAKKYNMSLCWFIRRFKAYTGVSPQQYIIGIRMRRARELLTTSSMNITEIAAQVGYDNPLYFSRIFKKTAGASPRQYRLDRKDCGR